jgi:hypothetical protein
MRKYTLSAYAQLLRFEDELHSLKPYVKAICGAVRVRRP